MAQVDIAQVDRDLLAVCRLRPKFVYIAGHVYPPRAIYMDGIWMVPAAGARPPLLIFR
jgi:hypothetical protein